MKGKVFKSRISAIAFLLVPLTALGFGLSAINRNFNDSAEAKFELICLRCRRSAASRPREAASFLPQQARRATWVSLFEVGCPLRSLPSIF